MCLSHNYSSNITNISKTFKEITAQNIDEINQVCNFDLWLSTILEGDKFLILTLCSSSMEISLAEIG